MASFAPDGESPIGLRGNEWKKMCTSSGISSALRSAVVKSS